MPRVAAIVVTYQSDLDELARLLDALAPQVADIVIVDNDPSPAFDAWLEHRNVQYVSMGGNRGIAAAQNAGIALARERGADHVIFFDDDSEPAPDLVERLLTAATRLREQGHRVAAVGPLRHTVRPDQPPALFRLLWRDNTPQGDIVPLDFVTSSGSMIPVATLDEVGGMTEDLFIDYVEIEWSMRAVGCGFTSYGVRDATMHHKHGDSTVEVLGRKLPMHGSVRQYYEFRNAVWTYLQPHAPLRWKALDAYRLCLRFAFYSVFARPRREHITMMARGIRDALRGRLGPYERT